MAPSNFSSLILVLIFLLVPNYHPAAARRLLLDITLPEIPDEFPVDFPKLEIPTLPKLPEIPIPEIPDLPTLTVPSFIPDFPDLPLVEATTNP